MDLKTKKSNAQAKLRAKVTGVALSLLMVVSLAVTAFEVLNRPSTQNSPSQEEFGMSNRYDLSQTGLYDIEQLKESNLAQAKKIKDLNAQLLEAAKKIQELKASLFSRTNPQDRAKLADLTQDLQDKELVINTLKAKVHYLEEKGEKERRALLRLEQTQEALADLNEKERRAKETLAQEMERKITLLQADADTQKAKILSELFNLQDTKESLQKLTLEKEALIVKLQQELAEEQSQKAQISKEYNERHQEITETKMLFSDQISTLQAALDRELARSEKLNQELQASLMHEGAQQQWAKTMKSEIEQAQNEIENLQTLIKEKDAQFITKTSELNDLVNLYSSSYQSIQEKYDELASQLEQEKNQINQLKEKVAAAEQDKEHWHSRAIAINESFIDLETRAKDLEIALQQKQMEIANKTEELQAAGASHQSAESSIRDDIRFIQNQVVEKEALIASLTRSLEDEKCKSDDFCQALTEKEVQAESLTEELKNKEISINDLQLQIAAFYQEMSLLQEAQSGKTNELEQKLHNKEEEISSLQSALKESENQHIRKIEQIAAEFQEKNSKLLSEIQDQLYFKNREVVALNEAKSDSEKQNAAKIEELTSLLNDKQAEIFQLQGDLRNLEESLNRKNSSDQQISEELENFREKSNKLQALQEENIKLQEALKEEVQKRDSLKESQQALLNHFQALNEQFALQEAKLAKIMSENQKLAELNHSLENKVHSIMGNLETLVTASDSKEVAINETKAAPRGRTYVVQKGDTLKSISEAVYGTSQKWIDIYDANQGVIDDIHSLKPGITLEILDVN